MSRAEDRRWTFTAAQDLLAVFHVGKQRLLLPGAGPGRCLFNVRERARKSAVHSRRPTRCILQVGNQAVLDLRAIGHSDIRQRCLGQDN